MSNTQKKSYTITCSSYFRDAVLELASRRKVNAGDIARSVMLLVHPKTIENSHDSGEPEAGDREKVMLKSGAAKGRYWKRKPRLQLRMAAGFDVSFIRRTLALALEIDRGELILEVKDKNVPPLELPPPEPVISEEVIEEIKRLKSIISVLSFKHLTGGVKNRRDAMYIMGFPSGTVIDKKTLRSRYRVLAMIYHPDSGYGGHLHMSQLNAAMDILRR
ncbi:MAG: J domain-containing protein [Alphaproteobacteria bacterium]|nr:J domain-containing protein [Alphaproteobacteria bacterium]